MSRPSAEAVREFVRSPEFVRFSKALQAEWCISTSRALDFWPLSQFANTRDRRQKVSALLTEVTRGSLDPHSSIADSSDPRMVWPPRLRSARVSALMPNDIIGIKPVYVLSGMNFESAELESLSDRLRERVPQSAEIKQITVYYRHNEGLNLTSPFCDADSRVFEDGFAKRALVRYCKRVDANVPRRLGRNELLEILSNPDFLNSPNICLFMSEIRRRIPDLRGWLTANRRGDVGRLFPQGSYKRTNGARAFIAFAGCLPGHALDVQQFFADRFPLEFW